MEDVTKARPWARIRLHGPCMIFDWHETEGLAREAIEASVARGGLARIQTVAYFPDMEGGLDEVVTDVGLAN